MVRQHGLLALNLVQDRWNMTDLYCGRLPGNEHTGLRRCSSFADPAGRWEYSVCLQDDCWFPGIAPKVVTMLGGQLGEQLAEQV